LAEPAPIFDVVIAGGGASGLALAAAVKQAMGQGASVAVVDPGPPAGPGASPLRTVAIADGPRRLLEHIGAWAAIEPKAQPILSMAIMDGEVRDAVRLPHLNFDAKDRAPLAHMAFNDDIVGALSALCDRLGVQRITGAVARWVAGKHIAPVPSLSCRFRVANRASSGTSVAPTLARCWRSIPRI
jgi:2-polyprenyl-6-methoxyphenol hydroxylase-like FAD-dependent oxidoreductase